MKASDLTIETLAHDLGETGGRLWYLAKCSDEMFLPTRRKRVGKKLRDIDPPKFWAKKLLRKIHRFIHREFRFRSTVHGGIPKHSCFTSAEQHLGRSFVLARDISDAYPSIPPSRLRNELKCYGFRSDVALLLSGIMTVHGRIPQGSPISSDALNFFMARADATIERACSRHSGASYSRVYDDFEVSTNSRGAAIGLGMVIENQAQDLGLKINEKKKRESGLQTRSQIQKVHNIAVNSPRGTRIVGEQQAMALEVADSYVRAARCVTPESFCAIVSKREKLHGWIHHTSQAHFNPAKQLRRQLAAGDRLVRDRLRSFGLLPKSGRWWIRSKQSKPERIADAWSRCLRFAA